MVRGQVVGWKHDADGNPIGRSNQNFILDTFLYEVEFPGGEINKLAANIIAELMYAQAMSMGACTFYYKYLSITERMVQLSV